MRYITAGESHGKALTAIIEGCPANLRITADDINKDLARRQGGHGRGGRMKIETDRVDILSGVRNCLTLGSPIALMIVNKDYSNWEKYMSAAECDTTARRLTKVRPAHTDLAGLIKYNQTDARNILERSSARETAARVAAGAVAKRFLSELGIEVYSSVMSIGGVASTLTPMTVEDYAAVEASPVRCADKTAESKMLELIDGAAARGDTLGGTVTVRIKGMKAGVGSHVHYERKLDYKLMGALASIQAVKGVELGLGFEYARRAGSEVHDEIFFGGAAAPDEGKGAVDKGYSGEFFRKTNNSGGIDGGISNGSDIVLTVAVKPIPTLMSGLRTVDYITKEGAVSAKERSDVCAVPAAGVVAEAVSALELMAAVLEVTGGDYMEEIKQRWAAKQ